jgi:hypothetical protein
MLQFGLISEYVRIENGEEMVVKIDQQDGWTSK